MGAGGAWNAMCNKPEKIKEIDRQSSKAKMERRIEDLSEEGREIVDKILTLFKKSNLQAFAADRILKIIEIKSKGGGFYNPLAWKNIKNRTLLLSY